MSLSHSNTVLQKEAAKLIDYSCPITNKARTHAMQRLQIELLRRLGRHELHRRPLHGFGNRLRQSLGLGLELCTLILQNRKYPAT